MKQVLFGIFFSLVLVFGFFVQTAQVLANENCGCSIGYQLNTNDTGLLGGNQDLSCAQKDFIFPVGGSFGGAKLNIISQINSFTYEAFDTASDERYCGRFSAISSIDTVPALSDDTDFTSIACTNLSASKETTSVHGTTVATHRFNVNCEAVVSEEEFINRYDYQPTEFALPDASGLNRFPGATAQILLGRALKYLLGFLGTAALVMYVYAGLLWMFSGGESDKQQKARQILIWTSIGLVVFLSMYSVVTFILSVFD